MRLDEWQKYIDSQFLDEEPEPVPSPKAAEISEEVAHAELFPQETAEQTANAEIITQEALFTAVFAEETDPAVLDSPDTAPIVIQNMVTLVVAPPQPPLLPPTGHTPRIEVLTPLPETASESKPASPAAEEVINRTRRRSQATESSPGSGTDAPSAIPASSANDLFSEPPPSKTNSEPGSELSVPKSNAAPTQSILIRAGVPRASVLFEPISDLDADIPVFQRYLPSSHAAALPVETHSTPGLQTPLSFVPETQETKEDCAEEQSVSPGDFSSDPSGEISEREISEEERGLSADLETGLVRRAPKSRARHARNVRPENVHSGLSAAELWAAVPRHVQTLLSLERLEEKEVAQFSYKRQFQEKRHELIERLLDPILSLEDTARLLNVCPTTVRRYTNKGILTYYRKEPERSVRAGNEMAVVNEKETRQRRFRLSDILAFLETQQAAIESDRHAEHQAERRRLARASSALAAPLSESDSVSNVPSRGKDS